MVEIRASLNELISDWESLCRANLELDGPLDQSAKRRLLAMLEEFLALNPQSRQSFERSEPVKQKVVGHRRNG
jgi:hypothetical protein